ncbi:hypothetical protein GW17_00050600, partial [Ensete ventricosum]
NVTLTMSSATISYRCRTKSLVSSVNRSTRDSTLSIRDSAYSYELSTPKKPSLALVEFLQARFKNIKMGFHRRKPLFVAPFPGWRTRLCLLCLWRIPNFTLILFVVALLMSSSNSL